MKSLYEKRTFPAKAIGDLDGFRIFLAVLGQLFGVILQFFSVLDRLTGNNA